MIVTEGDAVANKVCHKTFGPHYSRASSAGERIEQEPYTSNCVGSRCMAWQWFDDVGRADRRGKCGLINQSFEP